jgi:hypothetical protein
MSVPEYNSNIDDLLQKYSISNSDNDGIIKDLSSRELIEPSKQNINTETSSRKRPSWWSTLTLGEKETIIIGVVLLTLFVSAVIVVCVIFINPSTSPTFSPITSQNPSIAPSVIATEWNITTQTSAEQCVAIAFNGIKLVSGLCGTTMTQGIWVTYENQEILENLVTQRSQLRCVSRPTSAVFSHNPTIYGSSDGNRPLSCEGVTIDENTGLISSSLLDSDSEIFFGFGVNFNPIWVDNKDDAAIFNISEIG